MNKKYLEIIKHALGKNYPQQYKHRNYYRNFYCTEIEGSEYSLLQEMVKEGLMKEGVKINQDKDQYFHVTEKGVEYINKKANSYG